MPLFATTLLMLPSSILLSPWTFVAVTTNSYSLPFSNSTVNSLTDTSVIVFNLIHSPGLPSTTILLYTVYCSIFPWFSGAFHLSVIVLSVTSLGMSFNSTADGTAEAMTLTNFSGSFKLSPKSFVAVTTNSYTLPFVKSTVNSLTEPFVIVFNLIHPPGLPSVTILWYTVYCVICLPLFCGSLHFKVTVSSVTSFGRASIVAVAGTP